MPSQRVLVVAEEPGLRDQLVAAVRAGGGTPVPAAGLSALAGPQVPHRLVVLGWDGAPEGLRQLGQKLRPSAQVVALCPQRTLAQQVELLGEPRCNHVLLNDAEGVRMLEVTVRKFVSGDLFGIEKYLPPGTQVHLRRLRDYQGRQQAVEEVLAFADRAGVRRQVRAAIGQVCEELLMNALYDAPVDEHGQPLFAAVHTRDRLQHPSPRPVSLRYAAAEDRLAIAVRDRFGRLDKLTVLRCIDKCLRSADQIDRKTHGAGLGLYLVASAASQYVVNIAPGMATEVICTFHRGARQPLSAVSMFIYPGAPAKAGGG
ncbi:MAG: hypothetical protein RMK29_10335 [Myxococcales bacterium]|nr:hypothetical protein [Myxococcota bacterium]MDW8282101.1 hypothetical protein [Myxococcales bacterium]